MARLDEDEVNLLDFILSSQAATPSSHFNLENDNICEEMYRQMSSKIENCKFLNNSSTCVQPSENSLKLVHLNIRSLTKNFDALFEFISSLSFTPDLVCLTETRIKNQPLANITIPGSSFAHVNSLGSAGDVAIYISNNCNFKLCKNQHHLHNSESIWLDISDQKNEYIVAVIYRHPSLTEIDKFLLDFASCLADISASNKIFYALGDFNINIDKSIGGHKSVNR